MVKENEDENDLIWSDSVNEEERTEGKLSDSFSLKVNRVEN